MTNDVGSRIRQAFDRFGVTSQAGLARALRVQRVTVSRWITNGPYGRLSASIWVSKSTRHVIAGLELMTPCRTQNPGGRRFEARPAIPRPVANAAGPTVHDERRRETAAASADNWNGTGEQSS